MTAHGAKIKHTDGHTYVVVGIGAASTDQKFFGKRKFTLRRLTTDDLFYTYGKQVTSRTRLVKVEA